MTGGQIRQVPVVIVGAGPTGITAATLLAQYGVDSLILERWPEVYPQPRAVHLDDEICRVIARLGIADEFAAISRPTLGLRLLDRQFNVLAEFHRDAAQSVHGYPQANMFDQPELEKLLRDNLQRYPNVELRGGADVTALSSEHGGVQVTFTDRTDNTVHRVTADYVLGCDGANSLVRNHIGAAMQDLRFNQRWLVVDIATEADLRQWDGVYQVCDPARAGTYMRIGESRYRWEFRLLAGESAADFGTLAALNPLIAPWTGRVPDSALSLLRVAEYTFRAQIADRWRCDNIFILGDAAHLTPPFIGQGMGAGMRDAMNLSWKIAAVHNGRLAAQLAGQALDTYQRERKRHVRQLIQLALAIGWSMTGGGHLGDLVRRAVVPKLRLIPGLRNRILDSTTPSLCRSVLVEKSRSHRGLAGTLCPNPLLLRGDRLDDVAGAGFALITRGALSATDEAMLRAREVVTVVAEADGELDMWLRRSEVAAALIRPDRTVMRADRDVTAVCRCAATTLAVRETTQPVPETCR
ncbi:3-(3-hydroxyphenyl)propionate hydroxylase [Mycobacterium asiaticum]|uniref:3-(3-hydroxyphenyl)propionate hydroxylase n=1 Tax=Mycobacterium asiaticum TaxID=1790 RepID=A0A1A3P4X3_MYCAS|nr:bifunctional 3-(3-hydroxy-phenyl)propionate/3-hydroxycinnamic acid hydroxylase [Mycobacterium asiaticum]OBK27637.1 3-(3-hydroxyphenyl)propionate hydroxylase [Mycobacterium asiaticum]